MYDVGRLAVKIAGRDAGKHCVIVEVVDPMHVLVDGETRRRKVNVKHLEPLEKVLDLNKGASHTDVKNEFEKLNFKVWETKKKEKKTKPKKVRKVKPVKEKEAPTKKKAAVKEEVKKEAKVTAKPLVKESVEKK